MKRFVVVFSILFLSMFITASINSYFAFAKHAIETNGFLGDSPVFNRLTDFPVFCLISFLPPFAISAFILTLHSKSNHRLNLMFMSVIYIGFWLLACTLAAAGSAMNYGNTWTNNEIFQHFVLGNYQYSLALLLFGLFVSIWLIKKMFI